MVPLWPKVSRENSVVNLFLKIPKYTKYLMGGSSNDFWTSSIVYSVDLASLTPASVVVELLCDIAAARVLYRSWSCLCHFVHMLQNLQLSKFFVLHHGCWTGSGCCMHGDIQTFIRSMAMLATHVGTCFILLVVNSFVSASFHSRTNWLLLLFVSCCNWLIDFCTWSAFNCDLRMRQFTLMPVSISAFGNLELTGSRFKKFQF